MRDTYIGVTSGWEVEGREEEGREEGRDEGGRRRTRRQEEVRGRKGVGRQPNRLQGPWQPPLPRPGQHHEAVGIASASARQADSDVQMVLLGVQCIQLLLLLLLLPCRSARS